MCGGCCGEGCDMCGCMAACGGGGGSATMSWVGNGQGNYVAETTYKFVGKGGNFDVVSAPSRNWCCWIGGPLLLLVLILGLLASLLGPVTTTTPLPTGTEQDCIMWGDPHVKTFDGAFPNFYDEGEFNIVKTPEIWVQGRFLATEYTNGLAATNTVAIGGPLLGTNVFRVGPMDHGEITWNDMPIMTSMPATFNEENIIATYDDAGSLVDEANTDLEKHIVHIDLPMGMHIQIMRWTNYVNLKVTMPPHQDGQDGTCGNFNNDLVDDSTEAIMSRMGRIPREELLFKTRAPVGPSGEHKTIADCSLDERNKAKGECLADKPELRDTLLDDCVFDVCFGGDEFAAEDGMEEAQA